MTVRQHVFPRSAIKRFCDAKNEVDVFTAGHPKELAFRIRSKRKGPDADIFITQRAWDEHTEHAVMEPIEAAYQSVVDRFMTSGVAVRIRELNAVDSQTVTDVSGQLIMPSSA